MSSEFKPPSQKPDHQGQPASRRVEVRTMEYEGPIPHPAVLREFDQIVPGSAERILKMAEEQQRHRHNLEGRVIRAGTRDSLVGTISGLIVSVLCLGVAAYAINQDHALTGLGVVVLNLGTLAGVFIYGKASTKKERSKRES